MSKFSLNNLDKSSWEPFKFQEITERISISVDPTTTELEVYVGLEHIDAEDIHIRRFGKPSDVTGNKLKCFQGDVIFGKRRAYQRKAAIVDFDGICSAHSFVFRAKENVIEPELFPFFLHSDQFMHRAVDISVGGLSPTINWGDLKDQQFLLPPKQEQKKLAELLWAMDDVIEKQKVILMRSLHYKKALQKHLFQKDFKKARLSDFADVLGGYAFSSNSFKDEGIPVVKIKNIVNGKIFIDKTENCIGENYDFHKVIKYKLKEGDILIAMTGATLGKIGKVQENFDDLYLNQRVGKISPKNAISKYFLFGILGSDYFLNNLKKYVGEGAQGNISAEDISNCLIPFIKNTDEYGKVFKQLDVMKNVIQQNISSSQSLQKSLINQIF